MALSLFGPSGIAHAQVASTAASRFDFDVGDPRFCPVVATDAPKLTVVLYLPDRAKRVSGSWRFDRHSETSSVLSSARRASRRARDGVEIPTLLIV